MSEKIDKSQNVRLIDILALGPFMIWFGTKKNNNLPGKIMMEVLFCII